VAVKDVKSEAEFEQEVLQATGPVLVDFWAPWCGPCKLVAPLMKWAEEEYKVKAVKVEHGPNPALIEKYKVYGLPTLIVFNDGKEVPGSKNEGAIGKTQLAEYLKKYVTAPVSAP